MNLRIIFLILNLDERRQSHYRSRLTLLSDSWLVEERLV